MDEFLPQLEKYHDEFYRYIYRNVWDSGVAEDVFSSAVLAAYKSRDKFSPGSNFRAWMYRILTNKCFVANREISRRGENIEDYQNTFISLGEESDYDDLLKNPEEFLDKCDDEIFIAFRDLSTMERSSILLKDLQQFSYKEIAKILEIPLGTVMTHLARGRAKLRRKLIKYARANGLITRLFKMDKSSTGKQDNDSDIEVAS